MEFRLLTDIKFRVSLAASAGGDGAGGVAASDIPLGPGNIRSLSIIESVHKILPECELVLEDMTDTVAQALMMDGVVMQVMLSPDYGVDDPEPPPEIVHTFRIFDTTGVSNTMSGKRMRITGVLDYMAWLRKISKKAYAGSTSSDAITQMADEANLPADVDGTADEMTWLPSNRSLGQRARHTADHGYLDNRSCMVVCVTDGGTGEWTVRYKNITQVMQSEGTPFVSFNLTTHLEEGGGGAEGYRILEYVINNHSGFNNNYLGYGSRASQLKLNGGFDLNASIDMLLGGGGEGDEGGDGEGGGGGILGELTGLMGKLVRRDWVPQEMGNCILGSALIPTERGLLRLDELIPNKQEEIRLNLVVGSRYAPRQCDFGFYAGYHKTLTVKTGLGNSLIGTLRHPYLIYDPKSAEFVWKEARYCQVGDLVCLNPRQATRKEPLKLSLKGPNSAKSISAHIRNGKKRTFVKKPRYMTTELAKLLGYITAEAGFGKKLFFCNSNRRLAQHYRKLMIGVFGHNAAITKISETAGHVQGVAVAQFKPLSAVQNNPYYLHSYLEQLGAYRQYGLRKGKTASHYKRIPWSILQADKESQFAFLGAYIDTDGTIDNRAGVMIFYSQSLTLLKEMQILLNSHGLFPTLGTKAKTCKRLTVRYGDAVKLWKLIKPYVLTKTFAPLERDRQDYSTHSLPADYWTSLIKSRQRKATNCGHFYETDSGQIVPVKWRFKNGISMQRIQTLRGFSYAAYKAGKYDEYFAKIKIISESAYDKLVELLQLEYYFNPITEIKPGKRRHVYDLQMALEGPAAFIANGITAANTFKKYADAFQQNRMIKAAFNIECQASVLDYTEVGLLDAAEVTLVNLVGNAADPVFSGRYLVVAKTRHIQGTFYREKFEFNKQGVSGGGGDGGGDGGGGDGG